MPQLTVCLWNIQNYGQPSGRYTGVAGNENNQTRNAFIAAFLVLHQIDVLMIMEMQPGQDAALDDLVDRLNAAAALGDEDWAYSYCGCAIRHGVNTVTGAADLTNTTAARTECYAVVWRTQRNYFTLIDAVVPIDQGTSDGVPSPLNISQRGRPTGERQVNNATYRITATGGFLPNSVYPYELVGNQYQLMPTWPRLDFPLTGRTQADRPAWTGSRRPAYVVAQLADAAHTLAPVMAYHAPSNAGRAYWGALMAGLARELYVVDNVDGQNRPTPAAPPVLANAGFAGGDFNYAVAGAEWPAGYGYFTAANGQTWDTGAAQQATPAPDAADVDRRTTVQLLSGRFHNQPIVSDDPNDYLRLNIDLGFNRAIQQIVSVRVNLVSEIMQNPGDCYDEAMSGVAAYMLSLQRAVRRPAQQMAVTGPQRRGSRNRDGSYNWIPLISGAWGGTFRNWGDARTQYRRQRITTARCAAEFIHLFVSDHLPLISTFNY
ncbi:MAG TPA: hypothetical protein VFU36_13490 [Jatrophihabitans sp.]|nr:hypothetical protein [Jatrophihabitans sp.]